MTLVSSTGRAPARIAARAARSLVQRGYAPGFQHSATALGDDGVEYRGVDDTHDDRIDVVFVEGPVIVMVSTAAIAEQDGAALPTSARAQVERVARAQDAKLT